MIRLLQIAVALTVVYNLYPYFVNFITTMNTVSTVLSH